MINPIIAALGKQLPNGWIGEQFDVDGLEMDYGNHGVSVRAIPPPKIHMRLTEKSVTRPGCYSFIEVDWNRESETSFYTRDHGITGSYLGGSRNNFTIARERSGFDGMHVSEIDGDVVEGTLDPDGYTWWFDHNLDVDGGSVSWTDIILNIFTGPGVGTGTGTGTGEESGGLVINLLGDSIFLVTGGNTYINSPTYFFQPITINNTIIFASTFPFSAVTNVCPQWVDVPANSLLYSDSNGEWFALPIGTTGQILTVQGDGSLGWEDP